MLPNSEACYISNNEQNQKKKTPSKMKNGEKDEDERHKMFFIGRATFFHRNISGNRLQRERKSWVNCRKVSKTIRQTKANTSLFSVACFIFCFFSVPFRLGCLLCDSFLLFSSMHSQK